MNSAPFLIQNAATIRFAIFAFVLIIMGIVEFKNPRRPLSRPKIFRWVNNFILSLGSGAATRLVFPILAVGMAFQAETEGWGLLNLISLPVWAHFLLTVVLFDCIIYWQHRIMHIYPMLWKLHRVHHADVDLDLSSGSRFHPIEIVVSMGIKIVLVLLLGGSPEGILAFEIILNASAMFNHANWGHSEKFDRVFRPFIVTPDMHRIHHSIIVKETNSNYGFFLSCWDRWFNSYIETPEKGQLGMEIGIAEFRDKREIRIDKLLTQPFRES